MSLDKLQEWSSYTKDKIHEPLEYDLPQHLWDDGYTSNKTVYIGELNTAFRIMSRAMVDLKAKYDLYKSDLDNFLNNSSVNFNEFNANAEVTALETKRNTYQNNVNSLDTAIGTSSQTASNTGSYHQRLKQLQNEANDLEDRVEGTNAADSNGFSQKVTKLESDAANVTVTDIFEEMYPVGTVLYFKGTFNPATDNAADLFGGGTWDLLEGRLVAGAGTGTDTNGISRSFVGGVVSTESEFNGVAEITANQVAAHKHNVNVSGSTGLGGSHSHTATVGSIDTTVRFDPTSPTTIFNNTKGITSTSTSGDGGEHSHTLFFSGETVIDGGSNDPNGFGIIQPAEVVFMFKRTA